MEPFSFEISDYRAVQYAKFSGRGLILLVGPNGAGKSSIFAALDLLKNIYQRGYEQAINFDGGPAGFKHWSHSRTSSGFYLGNNEVCWYVNIDDSALLGLRAGFELLDGPGFIPDFDRYARSVIDDDSCALRGYYLNNRDDELLQFFVNFLTQYCHYKSYSLQELRKTGSPEGRAVKMDADGLNVFTVLRNWLSHRDHRHRYEFVLRRMRQAFGPVFDDMSFETTGQLVQCTFFARDVKQGYQPRHAADGVLVGLLHLTAIASLSPNTLSAIDDLEGALHPDATRHILQAAQDWCDEQGATLLIASQLPHVLDFFNKREDQVFIMRPCTSDQPLKEGEQPESQLMRLDEEFDRDWLRHFSLGDLYGKEFGVQAAPLEDAGE